MRVFVDGGSDTRGHFYVPLPGIAQRSHRSGGLRKCSDALKGYAGGLDLEARTFLLSLGAERVPQTPAREGCFMGSADLTPLMRRGFELAAGICEITICESNMAAGEGALAAIPLL